MSYTPTSWNTGDTITASALNKIEQGIANAGGGVDCILYIDSNGAVAAYGDFASALAKLASGIPICVIDYASSGLHTSSQFRSGSYSAVLGWKYSSDYPNRIVLYLNSSSGYEWTASGLQYWD